MEELKRHARLSSAKHTDAEKLIENIRSKTRDEAKHSVLNIDTKSMLVSSDLEKLLSERKRKLETYISDLQVQLNGYYTTQSNIDSFKEKIRAVEDLLEQLRAKSKKIDQLIKDLATRGDELEKSMTDYRSTESQVNSAYIKITNYEQLESHALAKELDALKLKLTSVKSNVEITKRDLEKASRDHRDTLLNIQNLKQDMENYPKEIENLKKTKATLEARIKELEAKIEEQNKVVTSQTETVRRAENDLEKLRKKESAFQNFLTVAEQQKQNSKLLLDALESVTSLSKTAEKLMNELSDDSADEEDLDNEELDGDLSALKETQEKIEKFKAKFNEQLSSKRNQINTRLNDAKAKLSTAQEIIENLRRELEALLVQLATVNQELISKESRLASFSAEEEQLKSRAEIFLKNENKIKSSFEQLLGEEAQIDKRIKEVTDNIQNSDNEVIQAKKTLEKLRSEWKSLVTRIEKSLENADKAYREFLSEDEHIQRLEKTIQFHWNQLQQLKKDIQDAAATLSSSPDAQLGPFEQTFAQLKAALVNLAKESGNDEQKQQVISQIRALTNSLSGESKKKAADATTASEKKEKKA
jgi:chromosome segregation ATPase